MFGIYICANLQPFQPLDQPYEESVPHFLELEKYRKVLVLFRPSEYDMNIPEIPLLGGT